MKQLLPQLEELYLHIIILSKYIRNSQLAFYDSRNRLKRQNEK